MGPIPSRVHRVHHSRARMIGTRDDERPIYHSLLASVLHFLLDFFLGDLIVPQSRL